MSKCLLAFCIVISAIGLATLTAFGILTLLDESNTIPAGNAFGVWGDGFL